MHPILTIATRAARKAGDIITRALDRVDTITIRSKNPHDFVTNVDREAEKAIIQIIKKSYPDHGVIAEEHGEIPGKELTWVIDPLDGTANYIHQIPHFAVSIGIFDATGVQHAVVYDPIRNELFTASKGAGAKLNDYRIRVSQQRKLNESMLATGFPFKYRHRTSEYLSLFNRLLPECSDMRRAGAASLDLAYVAAGRLDGFWEMGLEQWDTAAGALLIKEAGGFITDFSGDVISNAKSDIVAGNPTIHSALLKAVKNN